LALKSRKQRLRLGFKANNPTIPSHEYPVFRPNNSPSSRGDYEGSLPGGCSQSFSFPRTKTGFAFSLKDNWDRETSALFDQFVQVAGGPTKLIANQLSES
jgi:hypothetical protein